MRTVGIDPGLFGAAACWDDDLEALCVFDAPIARVQVGRSKARAVLVDALYADGIRAMCPDAIIIEKVGGLTGQSASASFTFGATYGVVRGIAATLGVPVSFVAPPVWRSRLRVTAGKDGSRLKACQLFPAYAHLFARVKDDGRAEAALISRYN